MTNRILKPKKVVFFLPDLQGAGAQRTVVNILNGLNHQHFQPILVLAEQTGEYLPLVRSDIPIINLRCKRLRQALWPLRNVIVREAPDLVFSTLAYANVIAVLAAKLSFKRPKVVLRETNNLSAKNVSTRSLLGRLLSWAYRSADVVIALSEGVRQDILRRTALPPRQVRTIYNPVDLEAIQALQTRPFTAIDSLPDFGQGARFEILAVGRLVAQKGFDALIQAFAKVADSSCRLTILGEGPERAALERLIAEHNLQHRVCLPGFQSNPYTWMQNANLFVLSSRFEGFGHVIVEAMACGLPVVATRCPSGPDEIITHENTGLLTSVDAPESLAAAILRLKQDEAFRLVLARRGQASVSRFAVSCILRNYEALFAEVLFSTREVNYQKSDVSLGVLPGSGSRDKS